MVEPLLQASGIVGGYGKAVVVQGVSVRLDRRELVALVGPNGSGKSTLLKTIYGLAALFEGTVTWEGRGAADARDREGPDGEAADPAPGRAHGGPRPADGRGAVPPDRLDPGHGRIDPPRRAAREEGP